MPEFLGGVLLMFFMFGVGVLASDAAKFAHRSFKGHAIAAGIGASIGAILLGAISLGCAILLVWVSFIY